MFTFLPALILLLLHGPANMEGRLLRAGERADVGSRLPEAAPVVAKSNRAFLAELLRKFPGATVLAALADEPVAEAKPAPESKPTTVSEPGQPQFTAPPGTIQRDRDGPFTA